MNNKFRSILGAAAMALAFGVGGSSAFAAPVPAQIINVDSPALQKQLKVHVGETIIFFRREPFVGSNVRVTISKPGQVKQVGTQISIQDRTRMGDEDRIVNAYEPTATGKFELYVTHIVVAPGAKPKTEAIAVEVLP